MGSSLHLKSELEIFEDIVKCHACLSSQNLCDSHANSVKIILMNDTRMAIEKLICK